MRSPRTPSGWSGWSTARSSRTAGTRPSTPPRPASPRPSPAYGPPEPARVGAGNDQWLKPSSSVADSPSVRSTCSGTRHSVSSLIGSDTAYFEAANELLASGSAYTADDVTGARKVIVIGQTVATDLFGT